MLTVTVDSIAYDRAKRAREIEYVKEIAKDDMIDDRTFRAESTLIKESTDELLEAKSIVDRISDDDVAMENTEINRILTADGDITFNEMADIEAREEKIL